jgi:hypothetical protein
MFNFQPEEFFEAEEEARQDVKVSFAPNAPAATAPPAAEPPTSPSST